MFLHDSWPYIWILSYVQNSRSDVATFLWRLSLLCEKERSTPSPSPKAWVKHCSAPMEGNNLWIRKDLGRVFDITSHFPPQHKAFCMFQFKKKTLWTNIGLAFWTNGQGNSNQYWTASLVRKGHHRYLTLCLHSNRQNQQPPSFWSYRNKLTTILLIDNYHIACKTVTNNYSEVTKC